MCTAIATADAENENLSKRHTLVSNLPTYTFEDALESTNTFLNSVGVLLYRPENDNFIMLYGNRQKYKVNLVWASKNEQRCYDWNFQRNFRERRVLN